MLCCAEQDNQLRPAEGKSGAIPVCTATSAGLFIGEFPMGQHKKRRQYKYITINGKTVRQHRFIVEQVIRRKLQICEVVHHKDGDGTNNNLNNLEIVDYNQHCQLESRQARPGAKLLISDIPDIRKMLKDGIQQWLIAIAFGVNRCSINDINCERAWIWV